MISKINASTIYSVLGNNNSLVPLGIKDVANSCGLTAASYIAGDKFEGKDRFIDEFGTQGIWLFGIPVYKKIIDHTLFRFKKLDPKIDPRIFKNKKLFTLAHQLAPNKEIGDNILKAGKNQKLFKNLAMAKFILSTGLTALTYFGLTKFRHKYTENKIKNEFYSKHKNMEQFSGSNVPFSSAFSDVHKGKNVSFTGGLQDFMFNPVKNLMIVDGVISGERLYHARNGQDRTGYFIKEGSFWLFMYGAGKIISDALEKHTEKKHGKSIDLDARVIENDKFKNAFKDGSIKSQLEAFKNIDKSDADVYKFAVNPENKNLIIDMAKKSDIIPRLQLSWFKKSDTLVDTRQFIDLGNNESDNFDGVRGVYKKIEKLYNQYEKSGEDVETFFKSVRNLKRSSVIKNMGACIGALGVIAPAIMLVVRYFSDNKEYQVKKDIENELKDKALA